MGGRWDESKVRRGSGGKFAAFAGAAQPGDGTLVDEELAAEDEDGAPGETNALPAAGIAEPSPEPWPALARKDRGKPGPPDEYAADSITKGLPQAAPYLTAREIEHLSEAADHFRNGHHDLAADRLAQATGTTERRQMRNPDHGPADNVKDWVWRVFHHAEAKRTNHDLVEYWESSETSLYIRHITSTEARRARARFMP